MNYLHRLIELKDLTCYDLATATGYGYHSVQKTVKGVRRHPLLRTKISEALGLDPVKTWGRGSVVYLRKMVAIEANRAAEKHAAMARENFLKKYSSSATLPASRKTVNV